MTRGLPWLAAAAAAAAIAGCAALDGHRCDGTPGSCGAGGACEPDGLCSFADSACPSGRAYGDEVAGGVAGQCTANPCGDRTLRWRDDFETPGPGPRFESDPARNGSTDEIDGQLVITVGVSTGDGGDYDTLDPIDLRGGALITEVAAVPAGSSYFTFLQLFNASHTASLWHTMSGDPRLVVTWDDVAKEERPWDGLERFWRISERGGTMSWDVSVDGAAWTTMHSEPTPFDVSQVTGSVRTWSEGQGGTARFESFTVCGP